jgi:hypothetical protein
VEFVGDAGDLGHDVNIKAMKGVGDLQLTAVAMMALSSMTRRMAAAMMEQSAASFMPVTHWAPLLAAAISSLEASLRRVFDTSVIDGLGDGFALLLGRGRLSVGGLVESVADKLGRFGISMVGCDRSLAINQ